MKQPVLLRQIIGFKGGCIQQPKINAIAIDDLAQYHRIIGILRPNQICGTAADLGVVHPVMGQRELAPHQERSPCKRRDIVGIERKGRHRSLMERVPTQLIMHKQPGLLGAAYCALELSKSRC